MMDELVRKQEVIDAVHYYIESGYKCDIFQELKNLPSAEPELKWIPVTEALPKVRTDVLLAFEKNMAVGFYSYGCWNVNMGNGFYTGVFTDKDKPIAWMPLPESYKGE